MVLKHCFLCAKNRLISAKHSFLLLKPHSVTIVWNAVVTCEKPELKLGKSLYKPMHFIIIFAFYFLNSLRNCEKEKCFNIFLLDLIQYCDDSLTFITNKLIISYHTVWQYKSSSFLLLHFQSSLYLRLIPYFSLLLIAIFFKTVNEAQQTSFSMLLPKFLQLHPVFI